MCNLSYKKDTKVIKVIKPIIFLICYTVLKKLKNFNMIILEDRRNSQDFHYYTNFS